MTVVRGQWSVIGISVVYLAVGALLSALCVPVEAQQPRKIPHIGSYRCPVLTKKHFAKACAIWATSKEKILPSNLERPPIEQIAFLSSPVSLSIGRLTSSLPLVRKRSVLHNVQLRVFPSL